MPGPLRVSAELGELHGLWGTVVGAGLAPEGWIPETEARKARRRLLKNVATGAGFAELWGLLLVFSLFSGTISGDPGNWGPESQEETAEKHGHGCVKFLFRAHFVFVWCKCWWCLDRRTQGAAVAAEICGEQFARFVKA